MPVGEAIGPGAERPDPGLALYHQTSSDPGASEEGQQAAERPRLTRCPNKITEVYFDLSTGEVRPARCGRNGCPYCVGANAYLRSLAVADVRPDRMVRVSLVADADDVDPWPTIRYRMNKLVEYARRFDIGIGELHYVAERNPRGTGFHAHAVQWGARKIDAVGLDECAARAGAGLCKVERIRDRENLAAYGLKGLGLASYGLKGTEADPSEALRLNGGRLGHQTRGFFRSEVGGTLPVREAERRALRARYGDAEGGRQWRLVPATNVESLASLTPRRTAAAATP